MTPLTHDQYAEVQGMFVRWMILPFLMLIGSLAFLYTGQVETNQRQEALAQQQLDISLSIEKDTIRGELSDIDHRIKQEECLIRPFGQVIRRDPAVPSREAAEFCDPDEALPDLMSRRDRLDARLREMGAYEVRDE